MKKNYRLREEYSDSVYKNWRLDVSFEPFGWIWFEQEDQWDEFVYYPKAKARLERRVSEEAANRARKKALKTFKPIILTPPLPDKEPS